VVDAGRRKAGALQMSPRCPRTSRARSAAPVAGSATGEPSRTAAQPRPSSRRRRISACTRKISMRASRKPIR
jgi:hypothetical protein